jgi:hypothetical protein
MMTRCPAVLVISFGFTKPPVHPENRDRVIPRTVPKSSHRDAVVCPRKFYLILSQRKLQDLTEKYILAPSKTYLTVGSAPITVSTSYGIVQISCETMLLFRVTLFLDVTACGLVDIHRISRESSFILSV